MIVVLFLLAILFLWQPALVQSFGYQFVLENNSINFDFSQIKVNTNLPTNISEKNHILSFAYQVSLKDNLPKDIPLFIVVFDKQVVFSINTRELIEDTNEVEINVADFLTKDAIQWPIFYKNNMIEDFDLNITNVVLKDVFSTNKIPIQIHDLNVMREKDGSLTIVFNISETTKSVHSYQLFCLNEKQEVIASVPLKQEDNFLWPSYSFLNLLANQKSELIFNLSEFDCMGDVYVLGDNQFKSNQVSIVIVENL